MTFFKVLSCPLCSIPINVTWHIRVAAVIANELNCPDRSKNSYKNLEDNDMQDTVNSTGEWGAPAFELLMSFAEIQLRCIALKLLHLYKLCVTFMKRIQLLTYLLTSKNLSGNRL